MTTNTTQISRIVEQVKIATDYQINKRILRERILTELHLPYNNGMFKVTPDLLAFLATWPDDTLYLEDVYQNPIEVKREELLDLARQHYQSVLNTWHQQHEELKRIRKV
jgi:hypothetical protein